MTWKKIPVPVLVCVWVCLAALAAGCGGKKEEPPGQPVGETQPPPKPVEAKNLKVLVGVLAPVTGGRKSDGEALVAGVKLAFAQKGKAVKLDESCVVVRDYGGSPTDVLGLARDLVEMQNVSALVGPLESAGVETVEELARQNKVILLTPTSGAVKLNVLGSTVWRLTFTDAQEGSAMAGFATGKLFKSVAILVDSDMESSAARAQAFSERFAQLGGQVLTKVSYSSGETDFRRLVRLAAHPKPDLFYLTGGQVESSGIIAEIKKEGLYGAVLGSADWDVNADSPVEVGPGAAVFACSRFYAGRNDMVTAEFMKTFKQANAREPGALDALGYDAGQVIIDALKRAGTKRDTITGEVAAVKLLTGVTGILTARQSTLATEIGVFRLKGKTFAFDSTVKVE
jgi:branched-chain amino acid transport system substrate-binding protein